MQSILQQPFSKLFLCFKCKWLVDYDALLFSLLSKLSGDARLLFADQVIEKQRIVHSRRETAGIIEIRLNMPDRTVALMASGFAVTLALISATFRLTIIYITIIKLVLRAFPSLFTKLCTAEPIPVSRVPVCHSI